jgi:hypothetical protein
MTARPASSGVSMDVLSVLRLLTRHWRVTAPAALLTLLLVGAAFRSSSPTYEATGSIVLLPPPEAPEVQPSSQPVPPPTVGQNPFARYGDLSVVADILARVLDSDSRQAKFESQGVTGYDVVVNRLQRGPVVDVTGLGPNPEAAIQSTEIVLKEVNAVLSDLQEAEGADPNYFIHSASVELPSTATPMYGSTVRTAIAALAVGALGTLGLAVLAEVIVRRREARPTTAADPAMLDAASNGSSKTGWAGIVPALRLMRGEPARQIPAEQQRSTQERSTQELSTQELGDQEGSTQEGSTQKRSQEPAEQERSTEERSQEPVRRKTTQQERSRQESAWKKAARTFRQEPSSESRAGNGHRPPMTDRSP